MSPLKHKVLTTAQLSGISQTTPQGAHHSLADHNPATTVSPLAMLEESHRWTLCSEREEWFERQSCLPQWHVGWSYYVWIIYRCTPSHCIAFLYTRAAEHVCV